MAHICLTLASVGLHLRNVDAPILRDSRQKKSMRASAHPCRSLLAMGGGRRSVGKSRSFRLHSERNYQQANPEGDRGDRYRFSQGAPL